MKFRAALIIPLLTVLFAGAVPAGASGAPNFSGTWNTTYYCKAGWCKGQSFPSNGVVFVQAEGSSKVTLPTGGLVGYVSGRTLTEKGNDGGYTFTEIITLSANGNSFEGPDTDSNGTSGTDIGTRVGATASVSVDVSIASDQGNIAVGASVPLTVKVTAGPVDLTGVNLTLEPLGVVSSVPSTLTITPTGRDGFDLASGASRTFTFKAKSLKAGPVTVKASVSASASSGGDVNASATTSYVVKDDSHTITMIGWTRQSKVGDFDPLPKVLSPDAIAAGDTVNFSLAGWNTDGGPIKVTWGDTSVGDFTPDTAGQAQGEFTVDNFPIRGTVDDPKPCGGVLTATQGDNTTKLEFKSDVAGAMLVMDNTKSSLKAGDTYCVGERQVHPADFEAGSGAIIGVGSEFSDVHFDLKTIIFAPVFIDDNETQIHVAVANVLNRGRLCVDLSGGRWVVIKNPEAGKINTVTDAAPCLPAATMPESPFIQNIRDDMSDSHLAVMTTAGSTGDNWNGPLIFTRDFTFRDTIKLCDGTLYGDHSLVFAKGIENQNYPCLLRAQGNIEIIGAISAIPSDIAIAANGDTILWGTGK